MRLNKLQQQVLQTFIFIFFKFFYQHFFFKSSERNNLLFVILFTNCIPCESCKQSSRRGAREEDQGAVREEGGEEGVPLRQVRRHAQEANREGRRRGGEGRSGRTEPSLQEEEEEKGEN